MSLLESILARMTRFDDQDLSDSEFRECDLTRARLIGVVMQDAIIDGLVSNLVINGVEVSSYVEAELDRRHPVRVLIRSADPIELLKGFRELRAAWSATLARLTKLPGGSELRARRWRMVAGRDAAPPGVCARVLVRSLLPGIERAAHRLRAGFRRGA